MKFNKAISPKLLYLGHFEHNNKHVPKKVSLERVDDSNAYLEMFKDEQDQEQLTKNIKMPWR